MHHGGECGHGKNVAGDFDGTLLGGALDFLETLGVGHGADVPDVVEDVSCVADQEPGKVAVVVPGTGDGGLVGFLGLFVKEERDGGNVRLGAVQSDVALTLLFGIIKRVGVQEGPDELAADVFEAEFKMCVLVDGVVAAVKGARADVDTLLVGNLFGSDQARRVAGACGSDGGVEWMREGVAEGDAGRAGFDKFAGARAVKHARLGSHVGKVFYTGAKDLTRRTQKARRAGA